jgi:hypothetical protein
LVARQAVLCFVVARSVFVLRLFRFSGSLGHQCEFHAATGDAVGFGDLRPLRRDLQRVVAGVRQQRATYDVPVELLLAKPELQQARMTSATYG